MARCFQFPNKYWPSDNLLPVCQMPSPIQTIMVYLFKYWFHKFYAFELLLFIRSVCIGTFAYHYTLIMFVYMFCAGNVNQTHTCTYITNISTV